MAGQGFESSRGHPRQIEPRDAESADLIEPPQGGDQARPAHAGWCAAEPVQVALAFPLGHDQQRLQSFALPGIGSGGEDTPEAGRRPIACLGDLASQDGDARQQDLAFDQPGRGQVEQQAGPIGADPGAGVEPADQSRMTGRVREIAVTIGRLDLVGMIPAGLAGSVACQARQVGDRHLPGDVGDDGIRDLDGIVEERPQESDRPQLQGEAQLVVVATP